MGCTQSKIENEEAVTRCKDRKLFMREAVSTRNAFAAAHSAYVMSLKNTGAALSDYAQGEVQVASSSADAVGGGDTILPAPPQTPYVSLPPPPPPLPTFNSQPIQRAASMPEFQIHKPDMKQSDPIIEEVNEEEIENESVHGLRHRNSRSSGGGRSGTPLSAKEVEDDGLPSPPPENRRAPPPPPPPDMKDATWDFFVPFMENVPGPTLADVDESAVEGREMERKMYEERAKRSWKAEMAEERPPQPPVPPQAAAAVPKSAPKKVIYVGQVEKKRSGKGGPISVNLLKVFSELDDHFLKASECAHEVSKMLEANRLHYHSNFADNRGHIDHSARVMRVITWNRSFRGLPDADDGKDEFDSEENETHATVLDKMLAWEKKLYDEVKAGEQMKVEYQRKVASLNKLKKRGAKMEALERTKAAVSHLHTRYIVDMQSMDSTVSEINRLRDEQLYPKLVELVGGMATMWETMRLHHDKQSKIVEALRYLDISQSPKETTTHHHERTVQLWAVVREWHSQFEKVISHQKDYIKALNSWLRLNLIPIDNNLKEKVSSPQRPQSSPIQPLLHAWHDFLEKLPDELARTAIYNFAGVMSTIVQYQVDEQKLRDKCEDARKELDRETQKFKDWHMKYMQRRTPPDDMDPDRAHDNDHVAERQLVVEILKKRLEEEEEAYQRQCIQVRDKSLTSLRTRLPELFRAMKDFSRACSEMYRNLKSISEQHKS
ncbi:hypothetical protein RJ640_008627 [Escallonia rubra]|uniref:Nitrate regulatory gene2 protein-like n=1 Tax=Escallonia rubra TaxID=112253 RepID=A0AA88U443_9ASTE|nr:hypothetical protein RJ640_008627 [Escallonia rubra]